MAKETSNEAESDECSNSLTCEKDEGDTSRTCSAASTEAVCSYQTTSDSASDQEECLAKQVCLKKCQPECSSCSGSSDEQSSSCSENSSCKSFERCRKSKRGASESESASASEDTDSSAAKSSTDATTSETSSKDEKAEKNGSKEEQKKGKAKEDKQTKGDDKSGWSLSEDALLRSMKEANDGLSWEDIGRSLNRGKNECKGRWKTIRDQKPEQGTSEEKDGAADEAPVTTEVKAEDKAGEDGSKSAVADSKNTTTDDDDKQGAADGASTSSHDQSEHERQRWYWHEHIARHLFPMPSPAVRLAADAHFSAEDCRALEAADARGRGAGRWLDTQARFYNATGRMVPLEVLRRKVAEGYAAAGDVDVESWLDGVHD